MTTSLDRSLPARLAVRLNGPLPGPMVGSRFEPHPRSNRHYDRIPPGAREAAVLILLYAVGDRWHVPLTVRPAHLPTHAGQVSLPGGAVEPGETSADAALREFREEMGCDSRSLTLLGSLSPLYVAASNYRVTAWVAATDAQPQWEPNPDEVEAVLEIPLAHLLDPANLRSRVRELGGEPFNAPYFAWQSHQIWGATCMILGEFLTLVEEVAAQR